MDKKITFDKSPEGMFLDECIRVIAAINARTSALLHEYEHIKNAMSGRATEPRANEPAGAVNADR